MRVLSILLVALFVAACTGELGTSPTPSLPDLTQPTPADGDPTMPIDSLPTPGPVPEQMFIEMIEEAAVVAGVSPADVTVDRAEAVVWNNGSLGCPEPGQMYTQALVDGYWVVLRAGGQEFDFRASQSGEVKLCPPGQGRPPIDR
ncbi:hypothetical protein BH23CHL7_BH23CHL7_17680 [soil metagenome]